MATQTLTPITLSAEKIAEMRLPEGPIHTIVAHGRQVLQPRHSPLFGEIWAPNRTAGTDHFLTVELLVVRLNVTVNWEKLDYHASAHNRWRMAEIARRLGQLRREEINQLRQQLMHARRSLGHPRSLEKIDAQDHLSQAIGVLEPSGWTMAEAAWKTELAVLDMADRQQNAGTIYGVSKSQLGTWSSRLQYEKERADDVYRLLTRESSRLDEAGLRVKLRQALGGAAYDKPWSFVDRLIEHDVEHGRQLNDPRYRARLAESVSFEGSQAFYLRVINAVLRGSSPWLRQNATTLLSRIDSRLRLLSTFTPLDPTAEVIEHVTRALQQVQNNLRLAVELQEQRINPKPAIARAKTMADEARFWLRYRPHNDPHWHRLAA